MLQIYLKSVWRGLLRDKTYAVINIGGLSVGVIAFTAIALYVIDEFSYDRFHPDYGRIYRTIINASFDGQTQRWGSVPNIVAPTAAREIPEIEKAARLFHHNFGDISFVSTSSERFAEKLLFYADPAILEIFRFDFIQGNPATALSKPNQVIISASTAKKYFGDLSPLGQSITVDNRNTFEITGVYKNFPVNSFFKCQLIASFSSNHFGKEENQNWGNASFDTFFRLSASTSAQVVEERIQAMTERYVPADERWFTLSLQPLTDMRLYSGDLTAAIDRREYGDIGQVKILIALAAIILIIAAINYMNLATAQSQRRHKDVGISKTLGATAAQLKNRFIFEAALFVLVAMVISSFVVVATLPAFNQLTGKNITTDFLTNAWFWLAFVTLWLILSLLSGLYPALYLASFNPKAALQKTAKSGSQAWVRKSLVVVQFGASVVLIICALFFLQQMDYMRNKKLGYQPEQVVAVMTSAAKDQSQVETLKASFEALADVKSVCRSQSYPGIGTSGYTLSAEGQSGQGASILTTRASAEVLDVLNIKLLAGSTLPLHKDADDTTTQIVINKSAADYLQLSPEEAIGRRAVIFNGRPSEIVGVTEDFHFASLHQQIGPYCFNNNTDNRFIYLLVKLNTQNLTAALRQLGETYQAVVPSAFEYAFLDEQMAKLYRNEERLSTVVLLAASIAVILACMGLYALTAYTVEQRVKEIGIRKVLGASVPGLLALLSRDFLRLVMIGFVVGIPAAYYLMTDWLSAYAYRIEMNVMVFVAAAFITMLIAAITISAQAIRTATANPVNALRVE